MKYILRAIVIFHLLTISILSYAQNCNQYHIDNCRWADRTFLYSRQSRSAKFTPGMSSDFSIVVYGGEEYYISIDGDRKLGDIRLRVLEDDEQRTQLYDNAEFKYEDFFYFKVSRTRKMIVEVTTEETDDPEESNKEYCVGVLIEFRDTGQPTNKSGQDIGF